MYETRYRKQALEIWKTSREETKQMLAQSHNKKLHTLLANLKSVFTHKKSVQ
jgi:hypothetical protein